jgi:hypothetical protein
MDAHAAYLAPPVVRRDSGRPEGSPSHHGSHEGRTAPRRSRDGVRPPWRDSEIILTASCSVNKKNFIFIGLRGSAGLLIATSGVQQDAVQGLEKPEILLPEP